MTAELGPARGSAEDEEARDISRALGHVLVDEVQDLVGCGAELVLRLLRHAQAGLRYSAILLSQSTDSSCATTRTGRRPPISIARCGSAFTDGLEELRLTENFRARTEGGAGARCLGPMLSGADPDYGGHSS